MKQGGGSTGNINVGTFQQQVGCLQGGTWLGERRLNNPPCVVWLGIVSQGDERASSGRTTLIAPSFQGRLGKPMAYFVAWWVCHATCSPAGSLAAGTASPPHVRGVPGLTQPSPGAPPLSQLIFLILGGQVGCKV